MIATDWDFADRLQSRLGLPRDVSRIWSELAPELTYGRHAMPPPVDARHAAVLVLLYLDDGIWRVPLIERTPDVTVHSSQICFAGGRTEAGETPEETALREFEEELGVRRDEVRVLGRLTPMYIYASNFQVVPVVAVADHRPLFDPSPVEVANLLEAPLAELLKSERRGEHEIRRRGLYFRAPHIEFAGRYIWGATSMMLAELLALVELS